MSNIFSFTCYINPPTKNEPKYKTIRNKSTGIPVKVKDKLYKSEWNQIKDQMYLKRFGMHKLTFDMLHPSDRAKLQSTLYGGEVTLYLYNGFKKMDLPNFVNELLDTLQGVAYKNDCKIKLQPMKKLDYEKPEFFTVIVDTIDDDYAERISGVMDERYKEYQKSGK